MAPGHTRTRIGRGGLHALLDSLIAGNRRNRKEGVIVAGRPTRFEGGQMATGAATRAAARGIHRMPGVQRHVFIRLEAECKALMALQAKAIVFRGGGKHRGTVHVVAARTSGYVLLGVAALGELLHRAFVAAAAKLREIFAAEARGGLGADRHPAAIMHVVAIGAGRGVAREVGRGQEGIDGAAAGAIRLVVAFDAGLMALFKRKIAWVLNEKAEAPALAHVGEPWTMA